MRSVVRALAAMSVVTAAASYGVVVVDPAAAVASPAGGCWTHEPASARTRAATSRRRSSLGRPCPTGASAWRPAEPRSSAVPVRRPAAIASGPVISETDDVTGASPPSSSPWTASRSTSRSRSSSTSTPASRVEELLAEVELPIAAAGTYRVGLESVDFDVLAESFRVTCNGQQAGAARRRQPRHARREPAGLLAGLRPRPSPRARRRSPPIADQAVLNTARPGDTVTVDLAGLASSDVDHRWSLCGAGVRMPSARTVGDVETGARRHGHDHLHRAWVSAPVDEGSLRASDGVTQVSTPLAVLGVQLVAAAEKLGEDSTTVTFTGTGWDPNRPSRSAGTPGPAAPPPRRTTRRSPPRSALPAPSPRTSRWPDPATKSVIVDQARTSSHIGSVYLISGVIGGGVLRSRTRPAGTRIPRARTRRRTTRVPAASPRTRAAPAQVPAPRRMPWSRRPRTSRLPGRPRRRAHPGRRPSTPPRTWRSRRCASTDTPRSPSLFGGSPERNLVFLVENVGEQDVTDPVVRVSVGRSDDVEPQPVAAEIGDLPARRPGGGERPARAADGGVRHLQGRRAGG